MKQVYLVNLEVAIPASVSIRIVAESEYETEKVAIKIAESQGPARLDIDPYEFLKVEGVTEITPLDPDDPGGRVWTREEIEELCQGRNC